MSVAKIGEVTYDTLAAAIAAADDGAVVELISDVELAQNINITKNIIITGSYTINRTTSYVATLFTIKSGATLTLDGGLVLDCGNQWTFDMDSYNQALITGTRINDIYTILTPEEGGVVATAVVFNVTGTLNLNNVTIKNHYSTSVGLVGTVKGARVNLNGAQILHCANSKNSGLIVNASATNIYITINEGTLIDGNFAGNNHGLFKLYSGAVLTMNGGTIQNTTGCNANGVVIGMYGAGTTFIMNDGVIKDNSAVVGINNGRNASIYLHQQSTMIMNGGLISYNTGYGSGGIDAPYTTATNGSSLTINGGSVIHNVAVSGSDYQDIRAGVAVTITGGTFTQDVSKWCAEDYAAVQLPDGTWGVKTTVFDAYVCTDGIISKADMYICLNKIIYQVIGVQSRLNVNQTEGEV